MSFEDWQQENSNFTAWQQENAAGFAAWQEENTPDSAVSDVAAAERYAATGRWSGESPVQRKTMWEAIKHGWEVGGMNLTKGLAGLVKAEAEFSDHIPAPMGVAPPTKAYKELEKKQLIEWSDGILEAIEINAQENPELAMQLDEDAGFLETTFDIASHPEKIIQGMVEAVPLMAEAMLGTIVAGPVGGIAVMAQPIIGTTYANARKEGTDPVPALIQAGLTGYGEAAIEQWTFGKKLGLARNFNKIMQKGGRKVLWEGTKLYGRGMVEEGTQKFNENLWNWVFTDRSQLLTEGVVQSMAVGGPLELAMGGAFAGAGYALAPKQVPTSEKLRRVEALRDQVNKSSISDEGKAELNKEFDKTTQDINAGKFDKAPADIDAKAPPAAQLDAAGTLATSQEALLEESNRQQQEAYEELLELAQEGDEVAAQKIQELEMGGPLTPEQTTRYEKLLEKVNEGDEQAAQDIQDLATPEQAAEKNLPTFETLFAAMLEGNEVARSAIENGEYKDAKEAIDQLEPKAVLTPKEIFDESITNVPENKKDWTRAAAHTGMMVLKDLGVSVKHGKLIGGFAKKAQEGKKGGDIDFLYAVSKEGFDELLGKTTLGADIGGQPVDIFVTDGVREAVGVQITPRGDITFTMIKKQRAITPANRGRTRVDSTIPASDEQARNFGTIKVHALAKVLGMNKSDRQQIQNDLVGQKSLKGMNLEEVKKIEAYFIAQVKERGLSVSTGSELADAIKKNSTQKQVQEMSGVKAPAWKDILSKPGKLAMQFLQQSRRVERLLEALDGYTEGPIYNSIWKVVQTQAVNSRVSHNARVAKFRDALVDIMTPELGTEEGIAAASEMIQAEDKAAGRKAKKLGKKAVRKLVGDSLWAKYITGGKSVVLEATDVDPELSLTSSEKIGMYLAMKNEDSLVHLIKGNLAHFSNPENVILAVLDSLSSQEQAIGNWILQDLEGNFSRANNAAKMGLGRELDQKDNYFPIRVIDVADMKQEDFLTLLEDKPTRTSAKIEPSETKERKHGAQQPLNLDSFEVYLNHLTRIEQFIHLAPVAKSVGNILNTKEFRQALSNVTSGHGPGILDRWLRNSIRGHAIERIDNIGAKAILWMRQKGVLYSLTGNLPSVVRQFLSGFNGVAVHPTILAYATGYMADAANPKMYKLLEQRMLDKSDVIKTRSFERELANVKHQAQTARVLTGKKEFSEIALSWQKWADRRTVTIAWNSFYDAALNSESVRKQFNLDGSDEAAIAFANKMIARTQPMGDVEHLPDFFTGGPIARLLSTFQNQVNNNYNFWAHDIIGMRKAGKISNKMVAYRALFSNILPAMMFGAISRGGLPDDWKDAMFDMVVYNLGPLMIVGRIITDAMLGFAGGQTSVEDILPANFGKMLQATIKAGRAEDDEERTKQLKKVGLYGTKTIGGLTGRIPNQAIRTGQGIMALATGKTDDLRRLIYSDWSLTQYGWPESAAEKEQKAKEKTWMKR